MNFTITTEFYTPKKILFGIDSVKKLNEEITSRNAKKVFLVTDKGVVNSGLLECVSGLLNKASINFVVFDSVEANPSMSSVHDGADFYQKENCDVIVALGGGSPMDAAKAIGVKATHEGDIIEYTRRGGRQVQDITPPLITIPTTSGTGSEVTRFSVLTNTEEKIKMVVASPAIISDVAIVDPAMTKSMPPSITAFTGMDALTHAIESYISNKATTLTETLAITAIELIGSNLRQAVANGENMNARSNMAQACMFAGLAFGNSSVGTVHAVAHALGGFFNIAHGVANALMLPHVMQYNLIACPSKFEDIATALGENVEGFSEMEAAWKSVEAVEMLAEDIGIPKNLKDIGADPSRLEDLVRESEQQGAYPLSPRVPTREATRKMFEDAFNGLCASGN
jgi:alcohol dehydrogenase class IV